MQAFQQYPLQKLFPNLVPLLSNPAPFKENWEDGSFYFKEVVDTPVLVVGAGGLGCQIVKNLALSGIRNIHLVDMDTIDFTNLNRQFMFRQKDINSYKADAVAQFVKKRCPGVQIKTYKKRVQQLAYEEYQKFSIIIGGLDNVQARKYLNNIAFQRNENQQETVCYYIDGATQGFEGQALLVDPYHTSCYECSLLEGLSSKPKVNYCTLANTPRTPEHCIQYVLQSTWKEERGDEVRDNDNLQHMNWVYQKSLERAKQYNIEGVTEMLTLGVTKNIIPAIASTNALIAAVCTNEVFKILSGCNPNINNYLLYKGGTSVGAQTQALAKLQSCRACKTRVNRLQNINLNVNRSQTLESILIEVKKHHEYIGKPFINYNGHIFLNPGDSERYPQLIKTTLAKFIQDGRLKDEKTLSFYFTDKCLRDELRVILHFTEEKASIEVQE